MLQDYEIKDQILQQLALTNSASHFHSEKSISEGLGISIQRAVKLSMEIYKDTYCNHISGFGEHQHRFMPNADTEPFLKSGGYTKQAKEQIEKGDLQMQKLRGELDVIANTLVDYPTVKKRASRSETIAILAVIIAAIGLVIQVKGCK